jgi:hypothetical protein
MIGSARHIFVSRAGQLHFRFAWDFAEFEHSLFVGGSLRATYTNSALTFHNLPHHF